mgnify:CR=1 FL=1
MSEELFYDRTKNLSGVNLIDIGNYCPVYGSSVTFSSLVNVFQTDDSYFQSSPRGINGLSAVFDLKFNTDEDGAKELANYYESSNGSTWVDILTDGDIYQDIKGYCLKYDVNHTNNQNYQLSSSIEVAESPSILNWSGMNYLSPDFEDWATATTYKKNDTMFR